MLTLIKKRERKPGSGRKAGSKAGPAVHFNTRISPEVRQWLVEAAERNNRTLSKEVEGRLKRSFINQRLGLGYIVRATAGHSFASKADGEKVKDTDLNG